MRQHYELGQVLKQRYEGFLSKNYNRSEIVVRSTDTDRTLMSAQANLAGMYPPSGSQVFNRNLTWQPIPVHTVPREQDRLLPFPLSGCPRYVTLMSETRNSAEYRNVTVFYKDFMDMLQNNTGLNVTMDSVWKIYDTLFVEKLHNKSLPMWVTEEVMEKLKDLNDFSYQILFGLYKWKEKARLQGGVLLSEIVTNISSYASDSQKPLKMKVYSGHDTTIMALQTALNVYNRILPPYASCHIFELHQEDDKSFSVAMYYRNDSTKEPYPLVLPGCTQFCPLTEFENLIEPVIPKNWKEECQVKEAGSWYFTGFIVACVLATIFALTTIVACFLHCRRTGYMETQQHS
ncbi:lysosomal acid phosphatase-like [Megalops cyprinoides]|uniref:lysosomal acid phosphatase-like n=1 Tax=Megalops cyprinoides TaxID=118141 RepID=UPI001864D959|nr:lysosomal acid phosphatase-like [Megalops cyprinoides]